jgi:hypothetical protein
MVRSWCAALVAVVLAVLTAGAGTALAAAPTAGDGVRHSGRVLEVRDGGRALVLEEMGPWLGPNTGLQTRTFVLGPASTVRRLTPTGTWESDTSPGYAVRPGTLTEIRPGDFVTVTVDDEGRVATIDITQASPAPGLASPSGR